MARFNAGLQALADSVQDAVQIGHTPLGIVLPAATILNHAHFATSPLPQRPRTRPPRPLREVKPAASIASPARRPRIARAPWPSARAAGGARPRPAAQPATGGP